MLIDDRQIKSIHKNKITELSSVGKSNDYNSLDNKPTTYIPSEHRHDIASSSKDGFMSKEDSVKLRDIKNYESVQIENINGTKQLKSNNINNTITIETGEGIKLITNNVNNVLTISAIVDKSELVKGPIGDKGLVGGTYRPSVNSLNQINWSENNSENSPYDSNILGDKGYIGNYGETGDKGEVGIKGETGDKGEVGIKGETGDKGEVGIKGNNGLIGDVGFKGETGDKGIKGETGDKGIPGVQGETGFLGGIESWDNLTNKPVGEDGKAYYVGQNDTSIETSLSVLIGNYNENTNISQVGVGKFLYNPTTSKLFFVKSRIKIIQINIQ